VHAYINYKLKIKACLWALKEGGIARRNGMKTQQG
jgi:hypothetical protein